MTIKNSIDGLNRGMEWSEKRTSELEDGTIQKLPNLNKRKQTGKKKKKSLRDLWGSNKNSNVLIIRIPKGEREHEAEKKYFKKYF